MVRGKKRHGITHLVWALSPGSSGGHITMGYHGLYDPPETKDFDIFYEARFVLLRTWGNPLYANENETSNLKISGFGFV